MHIVLYFTRFQKNVTSPRRRQAIEDSTLKPWTEERSLALDCQIALEERIAELRKRGGGL